MSANISQLVGLWYETIGGLHHKDRDCHFRLARHYRYDGQMDYEVTHGGYLLEQVERDFSSLKEAETYLACLITEGIREWIDCEDSSLTPARRAEILAIVNPPPPTEKPCPHNGVAYRKVPGYVEGYGCPVCKAIGMSHIPIPI